MKNNHIKRQLILILFFLLLLFLGIVCLLIGYNNKKVVSLKYRENNNIDYKVYLKDNEYFDSDYIDKGKTYITSLIDHIHIDYKYNIDYDQEVKANYKYKVVAQIEANKTENSPGNYWTKQYDVTKYHNDSVENISNYSINQSVDIDYNKYNEILKGFKNSVGLANSEGILKVILLIESEVDGEKISSPIDSKLILKMPLSQLAIEATIDSDVNNRVKDISKTVKDNNPIYLILTLVGILSLLVALLVLWILLRNRHIYKLNNKYEVELKRITNTYDSIIVNVEELPDMTDYNMIKVESFEELIDAHSEVRMPINYYQTKDYSIFLLFNDNTAWKYVLEKRKKRSK